MGDQPRLTTNETLMRDLEDSLALTADQSPIHNGEVRAKLAILQIYVEEHSKQIDRVLRCLELLAANDRELGEMICEVAKGRGNGEPGDGQGAARLRVDGPATSARDRE